MGRGERLTDAEQPICHFPLSSLSAENFMAKALIGYIGGPTSEQLRETAALHRRIADLEAEIMRLKVENDGLLRTIRERVDNVTAGDLMQPAAH